MKKCTIFFLLLLIGCVTLSEIEKAATEDRLPASYGKYKIESIANEVILRKMHPEYGMSECGLSDEGFMKYARERIDYKRQFQFIVFIEGKPLVGKRCLKKAYIFYLK